MAKHIKLFENFVNELHSDTYYSAADKMGKYSKDKASAFRDMGNRRYMEEILGKSNDNKIKFDELKIKNSNDIMKKYFENWISKNTFLINNDLGYDEKNELNTFDIAIDFNTDEIDFEILKDEIGIHNIFITGVIKIGDKYIDCYELLNLLSSYLYSKKKMPRKLAKWVFENFKVRIFEKDVNGDGSLIGKSENWRDLWDGQS